VEAEFQIGSIYKSISHGLVEYKGVDNNGGDVTLHFYSLTYNTDCYWYPTDKALAQHFNFTRVDEAEHQIDLMHCGHSRSEQFLGDDGQHCCRICESA